MAIQFTDNSAEVKAEMNRAIAAFLEEVGGELEAQVKRRVPVDTGQLKSSWTHKVSSEEGKVVIGSNLENAIWNEFGTGQYALQGNGRKTPWGYKDRKGRFHWTHGKQPQRSLHNAFEFSKSKIQKALEEKLKGLE